MNAENKSRCLMHLRAAMDCLDSPEHAILAVRVMAIAEMVEEEPVTAEGRRPLLTH